MATVSRMSTLEQSLLAEVSRERLWEYVSTIAKDERMSGSPAEREAMDYVAATLRSFDIEVEEYEHDGYVSKPVSAKLQVTEPESYAVECITHSFAASAILDGELVAVGRGTSADYAGRDVAGKIVLIEGLAAPQPVTTAEGAGAAGAVFINDSNFHQMIVTPVWGTPTPDTVGRIPNIPVVSVRRQDGDKLIALCTAGAPRVHLETTVDTYWARLPVVVGTFHGAEEPDRFVMLAGHIDSWFHGAIDNAAANATTLECMRILSSHKDRLKRGFRVVIWSGHSHGRYAGSTWYADNFWEELYDKCVAYVNVDSTGAMQATLYEEILAMPETSSLARDVIADLTGQTAEVNRVGRAGDQSFWGIGIPSVFMSLSRVPVETAPELSRTMGTLTGRKKSGQAWFWHTEFDTIDKVDLDVLSLDTKIYLSTIFRLMTSDVLPFDYAATVGELLDALRTFQNIENQPIDLAPVIARAGELEATLTSLNGVIAGGLDSVREYDIANEALIALGRILVPLNYTEKGKFEHDLALHVPALPLLRPLAHLAQMNPDQDDARFLATQLLRRRNQVSYWLRQAQGIANLAVAELSGKGGK